ncbi:MAG: ABC transporter permease, partial [Gemmatimonadota bacterium]
MIALLVGGVGVASAMRAYLEHKSEAIATLRCLGATSRDVLAVYLLQAAGMGLLGAAAGVAIGLGAGAVLPRLAADLLPIRVGFGPDPWIAARGLGVGFLTALGFSLPPLVATRRISPLEALRRRVERGGRERDPLAAGCGVALAGAGALLVVQRAGSLVVGAALAAGVAVTLGLLLLLGWVAVRASRRTRPARASFPVRQGIAGLHRPGSRAAVVIGAVGLGVFLLATLLLTEHALLRPLRLASAPERANLVLWDVQDDQAEGVAALLRSRGLPVLQRVPIVPMRIHAIGGVPAAGLAGSSEAGADAGVRGDEEDAAGRRTHPPSGWALRREC